MFRKELEILKYPDALIKVTYTKVGRFTLHAAPKVVLWRVSLQLSEVSKRLLNEIDTNYSPYGMKTKHGIKTRKGMKTSKKCSGTFSTWYLHFKNIFTEVFMLRKIQYLVLTFPEHFDRSFQELGLRNSFLITTLACLIKIIIVIDSHIGFE